MLAGTDTAGVLTGRLNPAKPPIVDKISLNIAPGKSDSILVTNVKPYTSWPISPYIKVVQRGKYIIISVLPTAPLGGSGQFKVGSTSP